MRMGLCSLALAAAMAGGGAGTLVGCQDGGTKLEGADAAVDSLSDLVSDRTLAEATPDESGPGYQAWCPTLPPGPLPISQVVPAPRFVYYLGTAEPLSVSTVSVKGLPESHKAEFEAFLQERGLSSTTQGSGLSVVFHQEDAFGLLRTECGLPQPHLEGAYFMQVAKTEAGFDAHLFPADTLGGFYALKTLRQVVGRNSVVPCTLYDYPFTPLRGVIEGFYGDPWSRQDRFDMMREIANLKYNLYVFGPKMDGYSNIAWPQPYPALELAHIEKLLNEAKRQHVRVCWEVHGGWPITFSSEKDMELILQKFGDVAQRGVDCFLIGFDDIEKVMTQKDAAVYDNYPDALADFVKRLGERMKERWPDALLVFVPHEYHTKDPGTTTDLVAVVSQIQEFWRVAWTGTDIISRTISGSDVDEIAEIIGRTPLLGDNYPVNDYFTQFKGEGYLHLGPITGRDKELLEKTPAVCFNTSVEAWASLPPLATIADYIWNPDGYDPDLSASHVALLYAGADGQEAMELMMQTNYSPLLSENSAPELAQQVARFWAAHDNSDTVALEAVAAELKAGFFAPFAEIPAALATAADVHPRILAEMQAHVDVTGLYGQAGSLMIDLLMAKSRGVPASQEALLEVRAALEQLSMPDVARPTGYVTLDFIARGVAVLEGLPLPTPHEMQ